MNSIETWRCNDCGKTIETPSSPASHQIECKAAPRRPRGRYDDEMNVLEMCLLLHMDNTGANSFDPVDRRELIAFLKWKFDHWNWNSNYNKFDDAVKTLIEVTLMECA